MRFHIQFTYHHLVTSILYVCILAYLELDVRSQKSHKLLYISFIFSNFASEITTPISWIIGILHSKHSTLRFTQRTCGTNCRLWYFRTDTIFRLSRTDRTSIEKADHALDHFDFCDRCQWPGVLPIMMWQFWLLGILILYILRIQWGCTVFYLIWIWLTFILSYRSSKVIDVIVS